jgi:5-methylcytosine-specific restriction endonuclease McrA
MHRHKRLWYYDKPDELLWDYKQWIIACIKCHDHYEDDREGTEKIFSELRGEENE